MNLSDDEEAPAAGRESGKRKIGEVGSPKPRPSSFRYLTSSSALESFGDLRAFSFDKFGALRDVEEERPNVYHRLQTTLDSSTGSFTPEGISSDKQSQRADVNDSSSTWSKYFDADWENEDTSYPGGGVEAADPTSHSSEPISCTLHERRSIREGPTLQELSIFPQQDEDRTHGEFPQNELAGVASELPNDFEPGVNAAAGSLSTVLSRDSLDHCHRTRSVPLFSNIDRSAATLLALAPSGRSLSWSLLYNEEEGINLPRAIRTMVSPSSEGEWGDSHQSSAHYPSRINYRFASVSLEASLLQRMEERERLQDEAKGEERVCGHVISPEDLIWGSVKHYCGMVLDRETRALLGTAVLFMPPDHQAHQQAAAGIAPSSSSRLVSGAACPRSAWVTCVKVVEGRAEVLIQNSKGAVHEAQLLLTSTALGLALFSVRLRQATFALAFLSRVSGPASLPHRLFVDVARSDRVYVFGYEEPWESEAGTIADVRVRPGRIVDAGRHAIVEIDFNAGRLGGSINSPAGFRGGLVVRADGLLEGVVAGEVLGDHPTNIVISSAFNVYALLEELQN